MYRKTIACGMAMVLAASSAFAQEPSVAEPAGEAAVASPTDKQHWSDLDSILRNSVGHPNETWRLHGACMAPTPRRAARGRTPPAISDARRAMSTSIRSTASA